MRSEDATTTRRAGTRSEWASVESESEQQGSKPRSSRVRSADEERDQTDACKEGGCMHWRREKSFAGGGGGSMDAWKTLRECTSSQRSERSDDERNQLTSSSRRSLLARSLASSTAASARRSSNSSFV